jgi:hypothetical protein
VSEVYSFVYQLDICSESDNVSGEEVNDWGAEPATTEPTEEPKDNKEAEYVLYVS